MQSAALSATFLARAADSARPMKLSRANLSPAGLALSAAAAALLAMSATLATPAAAQVFGQAPYVPAPDPAVERLTSRVDALETELRRATGRNEQLTFDLNNARRTAEEANSGRLRAEKDIEALRLRVDTLERIARGEPVDTAALASQPAEATVNLSGNLTGPAGNDEALASRPADAGATATQPALPQDEAELMKEARNLLLAGDYPAAQTAFTLYLSQHGKGANAAEAQYLLGESMLYQGAYPQAAEAYGDLLSAYPDSTRGPEGLVKLARAMRLMDKKAEACKALGLMPTRFPKASNAAKTLAATEKSRAGC